jgi:Tol biopolymer transport system component
MALSAGTRLGAYEIVSPLGAGGMGEVYRARDTRLNRDVALKVLPPGVADDRDRMARFVREAQAASALNHPHIVAVHDSGEAGGTRYIAMELVDGGILTAWVEKAGQDLGRVLDVFLQLADALAIAHEAGIVHRDLKPANVLVTTQGYVKVVDFGLAKRIGGPGGPDGATVAAAATAIGEVVGTVSYMAPEQALGRPIDARSDIFSFGVMLFEALGGTRPFERTTALDTLHAIVHEPPVTPPRWQGRPLPAELGWVLHKCLAKDPDERHQTMRDLAADLRRIRREGAGRANDDATVRAGLSGVVARGATAAAPAPAGRPGRLWASALVFGLLGVAAGAGLLTVLRPADQPKPIPPLVSAVTQLTWDTGYEGEPSWSPDGLSLVYAADRGGNLDIYLSQVSGGPAVNLTNDPSDDVQPAYSPDGKLIAFVSSRRGIALRYGTVESPRLGGSIFVMPALGGSPRFVADGNFPSWSPDGKELVFSAGDWFARRLYRVPTAGGTPQLIPVRMDRQFEARGAPGLSQDFVSPAVSPDGRFIAFEALNGIYVVPAGGGDAVAVAQGRGPAWVQSPLALVFTAAGRASGESLWRLPMSGTDGKPAGPAEPITVGHGRDVQAAVTRDGRSIAFAATDTTSNVERLALDLEGGRQAAASVPVTTGNDQIYFFNVSPDGRSTVYESRRTRGVWRADAGTPAVQLSLEPSQADVYPRWSPDGRQIAFARRPRAQNQAPAGVWVMGPDGSNPRALGLEALSGFLQWTPDSRALVIQKPDDRQLHLIEVATRRDIRVTDEPGILPLTSVSRDGAWLAFQSTNSPRRNIVIRALRLLEGGESRVVVDIGENTYHPFFSPSGAWLYFTPDHQSIARVPGPAQQWRQAPPERVVVLPGSGLFIEDPQPAADGRSVFYSRRTLTSDLWLLTLER